jgi:hypothetical protein
MHCFFNSVKVSIPQHEAILESLADHSAVICNDKCETPASLDSSYVMTKQNDEKTSCEISVAIDGNIEAWLYRGTPSQGSQWQQCWDSTENSTSTLSTNFKAP